MIRSFTLAFFFAVSSIVIVNAQSGVTLTGEITDSLDGSHKAGAVVTLRSGAGGVIATSTTENTGIYQFDNVQAGNYTIRVVLTGYVTKNTPVTVANAPLKTDIQILAIIKTSVSGEITDSLDGSHKAGAVVTLRSSTGMGGAIATSTTGNDGKYQFDSVQTGSYTIRVTLTGYVTKNTAVTVVNAPIIADIPIVSIIFITISGEITDSLDGSHKADAVVTLRSSTGTGGAIATFTTGNDGKYQFDSVRAGSYAIRVTLTGYVTKNTPVTVVNDPIKADIQIVSIIKTTISGEITDSLDGSHKAGAVVTLRSGTGNVIATSTTENTGIYQFDSVQTGSYTIRVTLTGYVTKNTPVTVIHDPIKADIQILAIIKTTVSGEITDSLDGSHKAGAVVTLRSSTGTGGAIASYTTGNDGKYQFDSVQTGSYTIRVTLSGYTTKNVPIDVINVPVIADIKIAPPVSVVPNARQQGTHSKPDIKVTLSGVWLSNLSNSGVVKVFSLNGKQIYSKVVFSEKIYLDLPQIILPGNILVISVSQNGAIYNKKIMVP
jgi:protocatechuate 3,4-dioxygenase beta subunit